jgi:RNA polymerase sigma-70 factor (ECF subfamily)
VKDFGRPNVNEPDVEETDAPVITRGVSAAVVAPAVSTTRSIVEAAFDAHAPQLKAFALAVVRDEDAAEDLVQETFIRFVRQVQTDRVPDNIGGWLHRVCANLITSQARRRSLFSRKKPLLVERGVGSSAEDRAIGIDESIRLRDALGELPVDARVALLMAAAGYSPAEVGEAIGRSTNATSIYICRARVRLREILSPPRDGEP